jgi:hypothetical protein
MIPILKQRYCFYHGSTEGVRLNWTLPSSNNYCGRAGKKPHTDNTKNKAMISGRIFI